MSNFSSGVKQDVETATQTCRDLQQLAKSASSNGGTVPNGVKIISALILQHANSLDLVLVAISSLASVLAAVPHAPALLRLEGGVKGCASVLFNHPEQAKAIGPTLKILARVCSNSQMTSVAFLKEKGSLDQLLKVTSNHLGDHAVVAPACELLVGLSRHEKAARLIPAGLTACTLRDVLVGYLGRWDVCSASLRVLKNLAKCDEARLALLRSTECTKLLLGVSRILARLPERRKLFKRAYRTLWLLFMGLLPPIPQVDVRPEDEMEQAEQPLPDEEMEYSVFPESQLVAPEPELRPEDTPAYKVRAAVIPGSELPGWAACSRLPTKETVLAETFHSDGDMLVARAMLHELERIMHPSRVAHQLVYDDQEGPLVSMTPRTPASSSLASDSIDFEPHDPSSGSDRPRSRPPPTYGRRAVNGQAPPTGSSSSSSRPLASPASSSASASSSSGPMAAAAQATAAALESKVNKRNGREVSAGELLRGDAKDPGAPRMTTPPLLFESRFESGNLRRAIRVYDREYDLQLAPDLNDTEARAQWFFFSVQNAVPAIPYKFNIVNLGKKESLYNAGMRPILCLAQAVPSQDSPSPMMGSGGDSGGDAGTPASDGDSANTSRGESAAGGESGRGSGATGHAPASSSGGQAASSSAAPNNEENTKYNWVRAGEDVCYFPTPYRSLPPPVRCTSSKNKGLGKGRRGSSSVDTGKIGGKGGKGKGSKDDEEVGKGCGHGLYGVTFTTQFETSGLYYLAMCYPYTYSDLQLYIRTMLHTRVMMGPRGRRDMREICRRSLLCRSLKGNRVDCLTITDFGSMADPLLPDCSTAGAGVMLDRPYVVVTARVHPGETNASWMMKGVLDFLLGFSPLAVRLRRTYVFKCVPMLNPDGVVNGNYRCSLAGCDLNRTWSNPSKKRHPPIYFVKRMIDRIARSGRLVLFCDLHGHSRKEDVFVYGCEPFRGRDIDRDSLDPRDEAEARARIRLLPFLIAKHNPAFVMRKCSFKVSKAKMGTGRVVVCRELGVPNSYTIEASFAGASCTGRHMTTREFEGVGHSFCRALAEATDAIEVGVETEMELLNQVDEACGLGLAALNSKLAENQVDAGSNSEEDSGEE